MKCYCGNCHGSGEVVCPECDGEGTYEGDIQDVKLERSMENYDDLIEFQKDANRVIKQARRLSEMKPERAESYAAQLRATLFVINAQADRVAKENSPVDSTAMIGRKRYR